ncbi:thioredoxin family protein, partial [Pseudomonas aeruginosa]
ALAEARQAGKPVLLDWYADWCISCKVIERQVLTDPTVQARLPAYRLLRFDITESNPAQRGLLDRYNLFGPPAILFFAPGGDEWSDLRVIGEIDAAGLAERLRRAATRQ